jgi:hypothetical protein
MIWKSATKLSAAKTTLMAIPWIFVHAASAQKENYGNDLRRDAEAEPAGLADE